ncbi:dihydroxyacetone kinase subunit DhaK, partial [Rhodococcus erythropolis]|nr:dihydroxyacetone kinase subunit DhaK [Rhodococcus erythropolis]
LLREDKIDTDVVLVDDDVATERADGSGPGRRGTAATIVVEKVCGASAARGDDLAEVTRIGQHVAHSARSMAVALRPCTLPGSDEPSFDLPEGQMELGIGIHGERGTERVDALPAPELVRRLTDPIIESLSLAEGDHVIAVVNGLGATHPMELQLLFAELGDYLADQGIHIERTLIGTFVTALNMAGASITLVRTNKEILELWDAPTKAPAWPNAMAREYSGM